MRIARARRAWPAFFVVLAASAAPALAGLPKVAEGFKIRLVASVPAVTYPCQIATAPDGSLFVAEDPMDQVGPYESDHGRILLFRDGKEPVVFAEGFRAIFGMVWHDGSLYVMNMPRMTVLRDTNGDGKADQRKELFKDLGPGPKVGGLNDHIVSGLQFGMDGWLYISVGDKGVPGVHGPDGRTAQLIGGGTMRCRPDGTGIEVFSSGTRNHLEPNLDARDNLFTYDNTDDGDGWWTRVTHHIDGGYYGYPYDYHTRPDRFLNRMAEYGGGSPCGGVVYKEDAWPEEYRGRALWAEWGKSHVAAVKFEPKGASFAVANYKNLVEKGDEEFRPIDLALSYDGKTLYIADWGMGSWGSKTEKVGHVYAVTYGGKVATSPRGNDSDPIPVLIRSLNHPAFNERMRAQAALIKKGAEAIGPVARALTDSRMDPVATRHLIWALDGLTGGTTAEFGPLLGALASPLPDIRAQAARATGQRSLPQAVEPLLRILANDTDPGVRLQAIIALGRIKSPKAVAKLLPLLTDKDPYIAFAARVAIRRIGDWREIAPGLTSTTLPVRLATMATLELQYDLGAIAALKQMVGNHFDPAEERSKALFYLSEVHRKTKPWDGNWWGTRPSQGQPPAKVVDWEGTPIVLGVIRGALTDSDVTVRLAAVAAVRETKDREGLAILRKRFATEPDDSVRVATAAAFGALDDKAALPLLITAVRDTKASDSVREAAFAGIETIGTDASVSALIDLLREPGLRPDRLARAVAALGKFKAKSAVPAIAAVLASTDAKVRASAVEALAKIGDTSVTPKVRALLKDPSLDVRKATIAALGTLKDRESIPALIQAAESEPMRYEATLALASIPDVRALQIYLVGLADKSPDIRKASSLAVSSIRDEAVPIFERLAARKELPPSALPELRKIFGAIRPIQDWKVVGPFPMKERPPFQVNRPVDTSKAITFDGKTLEWKAVHSSESTGEVDLNKLYEGGDRSAFAYADLKSDTARPARMAVGSDDTLHVWLNGKEVYKFDGNRGFTAEVDTVDIQIAKGTNRIVIRCGNGGGPWIFSVGVSALQGHAFLEGPASGGFNPDNYRATALRGKGKADHGKALFFDLKGMACVKCHAVGGQGGKTGPELSGVGIKYPREELISSVLYPSQKISSGYEPIVLATADGRVLTGILKSETPDAIEIEDAEAKRIKVAKADLEGRKASDVSLMPNGLAEGLSPADFADLIAYLETLKDTAALHGPGAPATR
jgi:putative membrane-bound dehydrogenase-like protein